MVVQYKGSRESQDYPPAPIPDAVRVPGANTFSLFRKKANEKKINKGPDTMMPFAQHHLHCKKWRKRTSSSHGTHVFTAIASHCLDLTSCRVTLIVGTPPRLTSFWIISSQFLHFLPARLAINNQNHPDIMSDQVLKWHNVRTLLYSLESARNSLLKLGCSHFPMS